MRLSEPEANAPVAGHRASVPAARSNLKSVALPSEHGGWGLTLEPCLLGLLIRPSVPGALIALATFVAFLWRTPAKLVAVDVRRRRVLPRTKLAAIIAPLEGLTVIALIATAVAVARPTDGWWAPLILAAPLIAIESAYEVRSRGRRLVPELAGAVAITCATPVIAAVGGESLRVATAAGALIAARAISSIPWVRDQVLRLHGRNSHDSERFHTDWIAGSIAILAIALAPATWLGGVAVAAVILTQRHWARVAATGVTTAAKVIGLRQMGLGLAVVAATAGSIAAFG